MNEKEWRGGVAAENWDMKERRGRINHPVRRTTPPDWKNSGGILSLLPYLQPFFPPRLPPPRSPPLSCRPSFLPRHVLLARDRARMLSFADNAHTRVPQSGGASKNKTTPNRCRQQCIPLFIKGLKIRKLGSGALESNLHSWHGAPPH